MGNDEAQAVLDRLDRHWEELRRAQQAQERAERNRSLFRGALELLGLAAVLAIGILFQPAGPLIAAFLYGTWCGFLVGRNFER